MNIFELGRNHGETHPDLPELRYIDLEGRDGSLHGYVKAGVFDEVARLLTERAAVSAGAQKERT